MLSGDNSILQKATDAKTGTTVGQEKETVALAYNSALAKKAGNGNTSAVTDSELNEELDSSEATATGSPIIVTFIKSGNVYEIDSKGVIKPSTPKDPNASNLTAIELTAIEENNTANPTDQIEEITSSVTNKNLQDTTKIKAVLTGDVPIPVGANYKEGTVDTGVVIEYKGSQFVWVPVPVTATNSLYPKGTTKAMAKVSTAEGYAGTDNNGRTNYEGVLYDFNFSNNTSQVMSNFGQGTPYNKEPDIADYYDIDDLNTLKNHTGDNSLTQTYLYGIGLTQNEIKTEMQENYNEMIESVKKYGGFFVGRYETSIDSNTTVASKTGTPMSAATDNQMWYGMYDKQKKFTTNSDVLQSGMIWGSQYDAMLNWMQEGDEGQKVSATTNGNHGVKTTTGGTATDHINNVYDLEGNLFEWTLEVNGSDNRAIRGCTYYGQPVPASYRYGGFSNNTYDNYGSRLSLYIK